MYTAEDMRIFAEQLTKLNWHDHHVTVGISASFRCEYCDRDFLASVDNYDAWQLDHIVPTSQHGSDDISNKALACKTCNFMKGAFVPDGEDRASRIASARKVVTERREKKASELQRIRDLVNYQLE